MDIWLCSMSTPHFDISDVLLWCLQCRAIKFNSVANTDQPNCGGDDNIPNARLHIFSCFNLSLNVFLCFIESIDGMLIMQVNCGQWKLMETKLDAISSTAEILRKLTQVVIHISPQWCLGVVNISSICDFVFWLICHVWRMVVGCETPVG